MISHLLKNKKDIKALYKQPVKETVYPHIDVPEEGWMHEIDLLDLPDDDGFKYALNIVDVYNSSCDGIPLKTKNMENLCHALLHVYENSLYLMTPKFIQADQAFNNHWFKDWCDENNINYRFTMTNRHRQNAHVERMNGVIGKWIFEIQNDKEIMTGKVNREWKKYYPQLISLLNIKHKKRIIRENENIVLNRRNKILIAPNTKVRLMIPKDEPQDIRGKKLHGNIRLADIKWFPTPIYQVVAPILTPNQPPMYQIKDLNTNKILPAEFTAEQLQVIG